VYAFHQFGVEHGDLGPRTARTPLLFHVRSMSSVTIDTWRDLLLPNDQDTRVFLLQVENTEGQHVQTSTFAPHWQVADPERLPPSAHLFEEFPSKIRDHLGVILNQEQVSPTAGVAVSHQPDFWSNYKTNVMSAFSSSITKQYQSTL